MLRPTKAAADDLEVVRRLRSLFPPAEFDSIVATTAIATLAADAPQRPDQLAVRLLPLIGHGWAINGRAITEKDVQSELHRLAPTLRALEARYGRLSLRDYHGLYEHTPTLAVFFLLTLLGLTMTDYLSRGLFTSPRGTTGPGSAVTLPGGATLAPSNESGVAAPVPAAAPAAAEPAPAPAH